MAKILFLHGLAGRPGGSRVAALCERGHDVYAPTFPFAEAKIAGLMRRLMEQWRREGRVADPLPRWTEQAQAAYAEFEPHLVVGIDLGAALALRVQAADTPQVLVAPPWTGRVNVNAIAERMAPALRESLRPLLHYLAANLATDLAVKPATAILHSPADEFIDVEDSIRLIRGNSVTSKTERAWIESLGRRLSECGHRPLFGRLLLAGDAHGCDCPEGLKALADAADAALAAPVRELVLA